MIELNKIYNEDCIKGLKKIEDSLIDLVIADPPYFKVINEKWDFEWRTQDEYVEWSKLWFEEVYNKLRLGGTFYLFGYFRNLAYLLPVLEEIGFKLKQQIIIDKGIKAVAGRATKNYKMFPNVTESVLLLYKDSIPFSRNLLKSRQKELKLSAKEINERLGVKSNGGGMWSIYTGKNICEQLPTKEYWKKLEKILQFDYPYEKLEQTFNAEMGITDVWTDIDFYFKRTDRIHPTQKPLELIERLILASSNEGNIVLDPFMGSGTTAIACINTKRNYIGFELDKNYFNIANKRIQDHLKELNRSSYGFEIDKRVYAEAKEKMLNYSDNQIKLF